MKKQITNIPSIFSGRTDHYDSMTGQYLGYSIEGFIPGSMDHFAADGTFKGSSIDGIFGGRDHYDEQGRCTGYSVPGIFSGSHLYNADGTYAGSSVPNIISGSTFIGDDAADNAGIFDGDP